VLAHLPLAGDELLADRVGGIALGMPVLAVEPEGLLRQHGPHLLGRRAFGRTHDQAAVALDRQADGLAAGKDELVVVYERGVCGMVKRMHALTFLLKYGIIELSDNSMLHDTNEAQDAQHTPNPLHD